MRTLFKTELINALRQFPIKRASLFGSFARGDEKPDSDVDILIEPESMFTLFDLLKMEYELQQKFSCKFDLVEFAAIKPSVRERILQQAVQLI